MMVNTKYDGVLKELAALLVPHLIADPDMTQFFAVYVDTKVDIYLSSTAEAVENLVKSKMDELGPIDRDLVREVCEEVVDQYDIEDKVNDYMTNSFDISDWQTEIKDLMDIDNLHDEVQTAIQGLSFSVEVSTR